jgi:hypothetical protein
MGTTKTALQAGSTTYKLIALIEGYSHPLTDATEAQAQAVLTGTDWSAATIIPGLTVRLQNDQRLDPWQPFHGGGSVSLSIKDSITDTFGIDTHKKTAGDETYLNGSLDSNDTTITVLSTSSFATSGDVHIGTECIGYTGKTGTTFTTCTRGKYAPFATDGGTRFGRPHRVRTDPNGVVIKPVVTEQPRTWLGRMVGVWAHRISGGVLDVQAQAQLLFAGRIVELRDDPGTMSTIVQCEHILNQIADATLGRDQWQAKLIGGIDLRVGDVFSWSDSDDIDGTATIDADDLTVVASGAAGTTQVNAGVYSASQIRSILNKWLRAETLASNINGSYSFSLVSAGSEDARVRITWNIPQPAASPTGCRWSFVLPRRLVRFFGMRGVSQGVTLRRNLVYDVGVTDANAHHFLGSELPYRTLLDVSRVVDGPWEVEDEQGTFADQRATLPAPVAAAAVADHDFGLIIVDDKYVIRAAKTGTTLKYLLTASKFAPFARPAGERDEIVQLYSEPDGLPVRQIFAMEGTFATQFKQIVYSTGTAGYNHATLDALPFGLGLGIPGTLLGDAFEASIDVLPGALWPQVLIVDKPTQLAEMFTGDLVARWAFPRWKDQILQFATWPTPVTGAAVTTLSEATKAAPEGQDDDHRTASILTDQWQRAVVKWQYGRDFTERGAESYSSDSIFEDPTAIDDAGGSGRPVTLKFPNLFGDASQVGPSVAGLAAAFVNNLRMFTQGTWISTRSISPRFYEGYSVGDVVLVTDEFARDPDTGTRGTSRPGVIVSHRYQLGGGVPGEGSELSGAVDVMFLEQDRIAQYVPCAQVDDTQANGGYNAGTKVLTCYAHRHSESGEAADASWFPAGSLVRVIEIDPVDPAAPATWDNGVVSQTGNTITLTLALTGWDAALKYRVVSDSYGDASATQQTAYAYQADDADGLVADARLPYQYAFGITDTTTITENSASDQLELPPDGSFGDGIGRDVGHEAALNRLCNGVIDRKSAHSSPVVQNTVMAGTGVSGTYKLVAVRPIYLGGDVLTTSVTRSVSVSAWFRSSDGTSSTVRLTLARECPSDDTDLNDIDRGQFYDDESFTTSSTSWTAGTAANLSAAVKNIDGMAYLLVECTVKAETRGACKVQVGPRSYA